MADVLYEPIELTAAELNAVAGAAVNDSIVEQVNVNGSSQYRILSGEINAVLKRIIFRGVTVSIDLSL
jgi:hypothetical protein